MIIGIDGNEANVKKSVGVSVYTKKILEYCSKIASKELSFTVFLKTAPLDNLPSENDFYKYKVVKAPFLWSQIFLPIYLFKNRNLNVFFSPAHYAPRFLNVPLVLTIHDLSYFYFPHEFLKKDLYKLKNWTDYSIKRAKRIIAVSKRTKKDIIRFHKNKDDITTVIYNGFEKNLDKNQEDESILKKWNLINNKYILYVGTLQPRKNIGRLIKAFKILSDEKKDLKLVIAGKKGWLYDQIFEEVQNLKIEDKVVFTDYVSDMQLVSLYKNALCFVLPSLYEGFGIPILEAMSFNIPVACSNSSSLPEIGADACLYFDPYDVNDMVLKIKKIIEDHNIRKSLNILGKERIKFFSWTKCAQETVKLIKEATI